MEQRSIPRIGFVLVVVWLACSVAVAKEAPLRVLIFSGLNNHDWRSTTPELEAMFRACPRFDTVDVTDQPAQCDVGTFARYDVIVSNWTPYPKTAREWPEATEKAFFDFLHEGGGFVVFHAAACTFQEWPAFQQVIGLTWEEKKTSHARYGPFKVSVKDTRHPIARGLTDFYITDELYQNMVALTDKPFHVVLDAFSTKATGGTDKIEPMLITMPCGKGRSVNFMLGHDAPAMRSTAFRTLMLRSAEWAATGRVTIPAPADWPVSHADACAAGVDMEAAVKAALGYRRNEDRAPLGTIENLVRAATSRKDGEALAACLAKALQGDATPDAKAFFCRELGAIGTEEEVPALAALLDDDVVEASARRALEQIPGSAADRALIDALGRVRPKHQIGVINSLGERRAREAVPVLSSRIPDPETGVAAASALAKMGTIECAHVLREALARAPEAQRTPIAEACLVCAEQLRGAEVSALCQAVERVDTGEPVRAAAWLMRVRASGAKSIDEAARGLDSEDRLLREAALRYLREVRGVSATHALTNAIKEAEPGMLVMILGALSERGDARVSKDVLALAAHADPAVCIAAIKALGHVGNADAASVLLDRAAHAKEPERDAARMSLDRLNAKGFDAALAKSVQARTMEIRAEALRALASRKAVKQVRVVLNATSDPEGIVREAAWLALKDLATPRQLPELLERLPAVRDEERTAAEETLFAVAKRMPDPEQQRILLAAWDGVDSPANHSLTRVMGLLGNDWSLAKVRDIYAHATAPGLRTTAVRALSAWPAPAPLDDLFTIARSDAEEANRELALQGITPMIARTKARAPEDIVLSLRRVMLLAANDKVVRAVLGEVGQHPCAAALDLALDGLKQPGVANEAGLAAIQAASALETTQRDRVKAAMKLVIAAVPSRDIAQQASAILRRLTRPPNLAIGATAASPDSIDSDGAASGDQAAIDGNPDTYWDEVDNQPLYIFDVTFKDPIRVGGLCIKGHAYHSHSPKDFAILCDGNVVKTIQNAEYDQSTNEFVTGIPTTTCKTIELRLTGYYGASPGIRELEVYAVSPEEASMDQTMLNPPRYRWHQTADSLALMNGDHVVWQFNYGKELPKPFFSPVTLGGGMQLTWLSPPDHWWHRGLWFSWKELNGVNYWEEDKNQHCQGCNEVVDVKTTPNPDNSACIEMTVAYHPPNEPPALTEKRVMTVGAPDTQGGYAIDWRGKFTAGPQDVHMKGGTAGGGYAGLSVRIAAKSYDWQLVDSEGREDVPGESMAKNTHGQHARWMDFTLVDMASGETGGIAIFDHPANLRFPSQWHNLIDDKVPFGYFSPAPLWSEPYTLPAGKTMTLHYRVAIHPGRTDRAQMERRWQDWAAGAK